MSLNEIVKGVVSSDEKSTGTYVNDGSTKQGAGSITVECTALYLPRALHQSHVNM